MGDRNSHQGWTDGRGSGHVDDVSPPDYDAVIITANYTSLRLRWSERDDVADANAADVERSIPAVEFLRRTMQNPNIIKGATYHGLWLLTTSPDILAGRRVLCNKVVLTDIINAGAIYTPPTRTRRRSSTSSLTAIS